MTRSGAHPATATLAALAAVLIASGPALAQSGAQPLPNTTATRLPVRPAPDGATQPEPERLPIDIGQDNWPSEPPQTIDILAAPTPSEAATAAAIKECADRQDVGIVAGEIVVCANVEADTSQLYSGSREAWMKAYAERTQNAGTLPPPDVAGAGIFRGPATVGGLCVIGPCPNPPALMIDVEALPLAPPGSDAERLGRGKAPVEDDDTPLSDEARARVEAELGLPDAPQW